MKKNWTRRMLLGALTAGGLCSCGLLFCRSPRFGALPEDEDLARLARSPHYAGGVFQNTLPTPVLQDGQGQLGALLDFALAKKDRLRPEHPLPAVKTSLAALDRNRDVIVWLGHSSFYMHLGGMRVLVDPVLSMYAAPLPIFVRAFDGTALYAPEDIPDIDLLVLSHDHWDHMDYPTLSALEPRIAAVACGLGVGAHLARFGFSRSKIREGDWGDSFSFGGLTVHVTDARHFSGRLLTQNRTLWVGFVLQTAARRIFFSGDSGYGPHFADIGKRFGGMDLALLDMGQYNERWPFIHMTPDEAACAADDIGAKALIPTHVGKFCISRHSWDEPFRRIAAAAHGRDWKLLTPRIGEPALPDSPNDFIHWWERVA